MYFKTQNTVLSNSAVPADFLTLMFSDNGLKPSNEIPASMPSITCVVCDVRALYISVSFRYGIAVKQDIPVTWK